MGSAASFPATCSSFDANTILISSPSSPQHRTTPHRKSQSPFVPFKLTYISQARQNPALTKRDIVDIVQASNRNNARLGITGALILCENTFLQTMEGEKTYVMQIFERIKKDKRHRDVTLIRTEEAPPCEYCNYSMSCITTGSYYDGSISARTSCSRASTPNNHHNTTNSLLLKRRSQSSVRADTSSQKLVDHPPRSPSIPDHQHPEGLPREYPNWCMKYINLNDKNAIMPQALKKMLSSVLRSHHMLSAFTQPALTNLVAQGVDPRTIQPRMIRSVSLFCDVVQFSSLAEIFPSKQLYKMLNYYYEIVSESVETFGGCVSKLLGDGVYATWRSENGEGAVRAVRAARMAHRKLRESRFIYPNLHSGFGISEGEVLEGTFGKDKLDYSQIGNSCNVSSRLEALTRDTDRAILFDESIYEHVRGEFSDIIFLGVHRVKGKTVPVNVYSIAGDEFVLTRPVLPIAGIELPTEVIRKQGADEVQKSARILSV